MPRKKLAIWIVAVAALCAGVYLAYAHWFAVGKNARESLLRALPADASTVIFADVAELRQSAILKNVAAFSPSVATDTDYKQFVNETGFNYERDLDRIGIAVQSSGPVNHYFVLADGKFDRKNIETYLRRNATSERKDGLEIFHVTAASPSIPSPQRAMSVAFLSDARIALTDADLSTEIESGRREEGHAEWMERFERLAGTPAFVLMRQDSAIGALLSSQAPGGIRSPQLAQLLGQLLWISIAGKVESQEFRIVFEGECPNEATMRQLSEFLNGITLMANAGLNDPKLRQQMDPGERDAYLQLVNSIDVMKLDRGKSKAVRATFVVTPEMWSKLAQAASNAKPEEKREPANAKMSSSANKKKNGGPKQNGPPPQVKNQ